MRDDAPPFQKTYPDAPGIGRHRDSGAKTITLRVLATTDLHMQLSGYDYVNDAQGKHFGLAGIAQLISDARQEAVAKEYASLLVDNGDLFQGGPLADMIAKRDVDAIHPAIAALNALHYDAIGLGNHDLDYGTDYIAALAAKLNMPVIASNLDLPSAHAIHPSVLLDVDLPNSTAPQSLKVGIVSVLPEHTAIWNAYVLAGKGTVTPALPSLRRLIPSLRAQGADVVILLAHMGIRNEPTDSALSLAEHAGADALIAGHTHRRFPGDDHTKSSRVDTQNGLLVSCPAVMPGHGGSDLAILDLTLAASDDGKWQVKSHQSTLIANTALTPPCPAILRKCSDTHETLRETLAETIGHTQIALHNYFSLAMPTRTGALQAHAKASAVRQALAGRPEAKLPLIAATAAHTAGGLPGPAHYIDIPPGAVLRRHLAGLAPYTDEIWGLQVTGDEVRAWLENAACIYHHLSQDKPDQNLINPEIPPFNFDTIYGLTYLIDPTRPPGDRISRLAHNGVPVQGTQEFVLATNQFRAAGGGNFVRAQHPKVVARSTERFEDALARSVQQSTDNAWTNTKPWAFSVPAPVEAVFETAPNALSHVDGAAHLLPKQLDQTLRGFVRLRLTLGLTPG